MIEKAIPNNLHPVERVARVVLGLILVALVFVGPTTPWAWIGLFPLLTGLTGTCPLYTLTGVNTAGKRVA